MCVCARTLESFSKLSFSLHSWTRFTFYNVQGKVLLKILPTTLLGFFKIIKRRYLSPFTTWTILIIFHGHPVTFCVTSWAERKFYTAQFLSLPSFLFSSLKEYCYTFQKEPNWSLWDLLCQMENKSLSLVCQPWVSMPLETAHNCSVCWGLINLWKPPE